MTQSIEIKDFTGGRNFVVDPFSIYPTEAVELANVCLESTGMFTKNYILDAQVIPPKTLSQDPLQISPKAEFIYDMTTSLESYYEKVRFYQGEDYILINGIPTRLKAGITSSVLVVNPLITTAPQNTGLSTPDLDYTSVEQYTYFVSYRNSAGFESPLEEINRVNAHRTFDTNYTTETASEQTIQVVAPPTIGDYGRIYRLGGNISFPSLVFQFDENFVVSLNNGPVSTSSGTFKFSLLDDKLGFFGTTWGGVHPPYLRHLTATKFGLAAASGSQVYLSMNKPDAWSALNMLNFGSPITALASVYRGFLVFTESTYLYLVSGVSLSTLRIDLVSTDAGCTSNASIGEIGQHAIAWIYKRNFYMFNGSTVTELEPNTYDYRYFLLEGYDKEATGLSYESQYILSTDCGFVAIPLNSKYKPFIDYQLETTCAIPHEASLLREFLLNHERRLGAYKTDGSFWALTEHIYGDVTYVDPYPSTEGWALGCYTTPPTCETDNTTCVYLGGFSGYTAITPTPCEHDGAMLSNYTSGGIDIVPITYRSVYKGPKLAFNAQTTVAKFAVVEVLYEGELILCIDIDDIQVVTKEFITTSKKIARLIIPISQSKGNWIQVKMNFIGRIYSYRVDGEVAPPT